MKHANPRHGGGARAPLNALRGAVARALRGGSGGGNSGNLRVYLLIAAIGALVTIVNISAYLHHTASSSGGGGSGGEGRSGAGADIDDDGLPADPHAFIEAHKNKKIFSAAQQPQRGEKEPSVAAAAVAVAANPHQSNDADANANNDGKEAIAGDADTVETEGDAKQQRKQRRRRRENKKNKKGDGKKKGVDEAAGAFLDPEDNNVISTDHDRNEVQSVHHVGSLGGALGGANGGSAKRLSIPTMKPQWVPFEGEKKKKKVINENAKKEEGDAPTVADVADTEVDKRQRKSRRKEDAAKKEAAMEAPPETRRRHRVGHGPKPSDDPTTAEDAAEEKREEGGKEKEGGAAEAKAERRRRRKERKNKEKGAANKKAEEEAAAAPADGESDEERKRRRRREHRRRQKREDAEDEAAEAARQQFEAANNAFAQQQQEQGKDGGSAAASVAVAVGATNNTLVRDFSVAPLPYDAAVAAYFAHQSADLGGEVLEQSSNKFNDFYEAKGNGVVLPTGTRRDLMWRFGLEGSDAAPAEAHRGAIGNGNPLPVGVNSLPQPSLPADYSPAAAYCDPTNADFTPESDAACMAYLTDVRNMQSIKPMSSILSTGRTIKLKVYYRHNNVEAVLKVSQKKFQLEPTSEVMAFHADRILGFRRVPPVVWAPIPLDFIRAAAAQVSPFYAQWVQKFSIAYDTSKPLITPCFPPSSSSSANRQGQQLSDDEGPIPPPHSGQCLNVSLQLWLFDVHNAEDTYISPPRKYRHLLNVPFPSSSEEGGGGDGDGGGPVIIRRKGGKRVGEDGREVPPPPPPPPPAAATKKPMSAAERSLIEDPLLRLAVAEQMDQYVFDYVIGNSDRWQGHNSFALGASTRFAAPSLLLPPPGGGGGANNNAAEDAALPPPSVIFKKASEIRTISTPRLAFIDQGSAFYGRTGPEMNPFTKNTGPFCRFRRSTVENFLRAVPTTAEELAAAEQQQQQSRRRSSSADVPILSRLIKDRLPKGIFYLSTNTLLRAAGQRADRVAVHMRECLANFTEAEVLYF